MGLAGLEPATSRLSGVRSSQLSYKPRGAGIITKSIPTEQPDRPQKPFGPAHAVSVLTRNVFAQQFRHQAAVAHGVGDLVRGFGTRGLGNGGGLFHFFLDR